MAPDAFERYVARILARGAQPLGRIENAWHILDRDGHPALVVVKHIHHEPDDVLHLDALMVRYHIPRGYLVHPGDFNTPTQDAAYIFDNITLVDLDLLEHLEAIP